MRSFELFVLDNTRDPVLLLENSAVTFVNKIFEEVVGTLQQDLIGTKPVDWNFLSPEERVEFNDVLASSDLTCTKEFFIQKGTERTVMNIHVCKYNDQLVCCYFRSITNPAERKQLTSKEEEIRLLRTLIDLSPIRMGVVDVLDNFTNCKYVIANSAFAESLKTTPQLLEGKTTAETGISLDACKKWGDQFRSCLGNPNPVSLEFECWKPLDRTRKESVACRILHHGGNRFSFVRTNITTRVRLENELKKSRHELETTVKQLEKALTVKSAFLANMSHEIRTPLNGVISVLSLLQVSPDQQDLITMGTVCGQQLAVVINDILDLTKLDDNKVCIESKPFSLRSVFFDSMDMILLEATKKGLELICDIDITLEDEVVGDPTRLRQIVINLLSNAVKFSLKGEIVLRASLGKAEEFSCSDMVIHVSVADQGIGIPQKDQLKLFQPFAQGDSSMNRRYGGSGLGLAICQRLAGLMRGRVWFESVEGQGSTFHFTVQLQKSGDRSWSLTPPTEFHGKRILVVDQSLTCLRILQTKLMYWGFQVEIAQNFHVELENHKFDVMLIDSRLSESVPCTNSIPIIWMTYDRNRQHSLRKPINDCALMGRLESVLCGVTESPITKSPTTLNVVEGFDQKSVLLAEDNPMNQKIIAKMLAKLGCQNLKIADNGKEAVDSCMRNSFDLILMDLMMPEMNGMEATECILKLPFKRPPTIVALTADASSETKRKCLETGMKDVLTKPVDVFKLRQLICT